MKKYKIATLGCRTNQYESQAYADQLAEIGFFEAEKGESADLCIVNTCTVTESADKRSLAAIRKLMKSYPEAKMMVTGCMAEREGKRLQELGENVLIVPNSEKEKLLEKAFPDLKKLPEFSIKNFEAHTRAFVKIQDGCNSYCSYCVIPYVRGRSRSKKVDEILKEIASLVQNGFKEIVLTGINIGDFDGGDPESPTRLHELIREVDKIEGLERIRVSSIDPDEVDDALLEAICCGKKTCQSMHIVLQSGSNSVLKRMRRKYTKQDFFRTIDRLKRASSDFTFTTDLIVGFPGESDFDFEESLSIIREVSFAKVHMFPYSDRPKTRASRFEDKVASEIIEARRKIVLERAEEVSFSLRSRFVGRTMPVLLEDEDPHRPGYIRGHTDNFLLVTLPKKGHRSNDIANVCLRENAQDALMGESL